MNRTDSLPLAPTVSCARLGLVSPLALGGLGFGWTLTEAESCSLLDAYFQAGGTLLDTSDNYSFWMQGGQGGESEAIIGRWLRSLPPGKARPLIATKVGFQTALGSGLGHDHLLRSAESSRSRLGVATIDLYQLHGPDPATSLMETAEALAWLTEQRVIRAVGFCNMSAMQVMAYADAMKSAGIPPPVAFQGKLNYLERERVAQDLVQFLRERDMLFLPYGVLARGFLSGKYQRDDAAVDSRRAGSVRRRYCHEDQFSRLEVFLDRAGEDGLSPSQAAYRWLLEDLAARGITASPVGGFTHVSQLQEILRILPLGAFRT